MKYYLTKIYNQKIIKIMFQEEEGKTPELMAIVPYKGHKNSWEFAVRLELAEFIRASLEVDHKASRKRVGEIMKAYAIDKPFILETKNLPLYP